MPDIDRKPTRFGEGELPISVDEMGALAPRDGERVGTGRANASFGELVQGRLPDGEDFLVTAPITLKSECRVVAAREKGPLSIDCRWEKCRAVVMRVLSVLGIDANTRLRVDLSSDIPVGKGLSSSTADMLATLRALEDAFGFRAGHRFIAETFADIEPHDGLQYDSCVAYNHRRGALLQDFAYIPAFGIVAIDSGSQVDTKSYNRSLQFDHNEMVEYASLLSRLRKAFDARDDKTIAAVATCSLQMHANRIRNEFFRDSVSIGHRYDALGVIATHSGTCAGLVFDGDTPSSALLEIAQEIEQRLLKNTFVTRTLRHID